MKIYTKTGDGGETGLPGGRRVVKSDAVIEVLGTIDELNAAIGLAIVYLEDRNSKGKKKRELSVLLSRLGEIQGDLLTAGAIVSGGWIDREDDLAIRTKELEEQIDNHQRALGRLRQFILPRGPLHPARAVCRRAERRAVRLDGGRFRGVLIYLNRLSDYLFVAARKTAALLGEAEVVWPGPDAGRNGSGRLAK